MAYRPSKRRHTHSESDDLNLTPMIDIFIIIIFFLLLTAVFAKTAIIDMYLPQEGGASAQSNAVPEVLSIKVTEKGFELGGIGGGSVIPRTEGNLDFKELTKQLSGVKDKHPQKEDIVLLFDPGIQYDTVVKVMDACRETSENQTGETGKRTLFPLVSLAENR